MRSAVVIGAQGVIGRHIVEKLASLPDWQVVGLSRRRGQEGVRVRHIAVGLLDPAAADYAKNIAANHDLLVNSVSAISRWASAGPGPNCANQAYNITNGDYFRWQHVGPKIARFRAERIVP